MARPIRHLCQRQCAHLARRTPVARMIRTRLLPALLAGSCAVTAGAAPAPSPSLLRDLDAYAAASCLAALDHPFLKDQGERWAGAVVQRSAGPIAAWRPVADAVRLELKRAGIAQAQGAGPRAPALALPVMTCGEIADAPPVRRAIARAAATLTGAYPRKPR